MKCFIVRLNPIFSTSQCDPRGPSNIAEQCTVDSCRIHFCSPVAELNRSLGTQKLSGVDKIVRPKQDRSTLNHHTHTCIHHRIQLAVGDMTMGGWKPTISLIQHPPPQQFISSFEMSTYSIIRCCVSDTVHVSSVLGGRLFCVVDIVFM